MISKMLRLKSALRNSSHLSASSRRSEEKQKTGFQTERIPQERNIIFESPHTIKAESDSNL